MSRGVYNKTKSIKLQKLSKKYAFLFVSRQNVCVCRLRIFVETLVFENLLSDHDSPPKIASDAFSILNCFSLFLQTFSIFVVLQKLGDHNFQSRKRLSFLSLFTIAIAIYRIRFAWVYYIMRRITIFAKESME